ncbi:hypothetical protein SAMN05216499_118130 [Actinacidiphila paucisporea]|uniref:Uncharacterized protein n=2 Tax=Actinacidiphila paucisporea TaxID=310782 RepID=A0A1M7NGA2_9ACTN|nr:hypothetical protein SAMN05216499_118130 [Actinacidiphila paucisporea]
MREERPARPRSGRRSRPYDAQMFDSFPPPDRSRHEEVPSDWPFLLARADPPVDGDLCSTRRSDVVVATRDGGWEEAVVWAWTWNDNGHPVRWRCQVELGGHVSWYVHDSHLIRPVEGC